MTVSPVPFRVDLCASSVPSRETSTTAALHIYANSVTVEAAWRDKLCGRDERKYRLRFGFTR
jgi:hypothetical protein